MRGGRVVTPLSTSCIKNSNLNKGCNDMRRLEIPLLHQNILEEEGRSLECHMLVPFIYRVNSDVKFIGNMPHYKEG